MARGDSRWSLAASFRIKTFIGFQAAKAASKSEAQFHNAGAAVTAEAVPSGPKRHPAPLA
jgi:hypothetical protein